MEEFRPKSSAAIAMIALARKFESNPFTKDTWIRSFTAEVPDKDPATWDRKIEQGATFGVIPREIKQIRKKLEILPDHRVLVIPVFTGEWSKIHEGATGVDFSPTALKHHPNEKRVLADARDLPFKKGEFDHVVSYELTPLNLGLSDPPSVLKTLKELLRVGKRVHIIQRMHDGRLAWTDPIITRYLKELKIPHKVVDISAHTEPRYFFYDPHRDKVVSLSIDSTPAQKHLEKIKRDIQVLEEAMEPMKRGKISKGAEIIAEGGSTALQRAFFEQYFLGTISPFTARRLVTRIKGRVHGTHS